MAMADASPYIKLCVGRGRRKMNSFFKIINKFTDASILHQN